MTNLLAGLAKRAVCGGGLVVETYRHTKGKPRVPHYVCARRRASGDKACSNGLRIRVEDMNEAVLTAIEEHALRPEAVEAVVATMQRDVSATVARSITERVRLSREVAARKAQRPKKRPRQSEQFASTSVLFGPVSTGQPASPARERETIGEA